MVEKNRKKTSVDTSVDKTVVRALALGGLLGGCDPSCVDVKNGKILRIQRGNLSQFEQHPISCPYARAFLQQPTHPWPAPPPRVPQVLAVLRSRPEDTKP